MQGISASGGIGIGKAVIIRESSLVYRPKRITEYETDNELKRFNNAVTSLCKKLQEQSEQLKSVIGQKEADILKSHINLIKDPYIVSEIEKCIKSGQCCELAAEGVLDKFSALFSQAKDELTRQRSCDIRDIKISLLNILIGNANNELTNVPKGSVIVIKELTPSMTVGLNAENISGIVTETGGTTSHSAIIARAFEIPAVLNIPNVSEIIKDGDTVIVDGNQGNVICSPDDDLISKFTQKRFQFLQEKKELESFRGLPTLSADNVQYELFCNIGNANDALKTIECDGEGVGLFRTEFLFIDRNCSPTEEEQFESYKQAALTLKNKPLIIRTLDIGGDKNIPYLNISKEENPFMGLRAIRYCLKNRDLFKTQIRAVLRASIFGDVRIMFPLITCAEELREGKRIVEEIKSELYSEKIEFNRNIKIGIMIETAAAAEISDILAKECDFFSIGTNDLIGYTMACDRGNGDVSYLYFPMQISVLRMIKRTIESGHISNIPVGMCGEAAADPMMIPLLISFGITEFSVSPPSVLKVRKSIAKWTKEKADEVAENVMNLTSVSEICEYLKTVI